MTVSENTLQGGKGYAQRGSQESSPGNRKMMTIELLTQDEGLPRAAALVIQPEDAGQRSGVPLLEGSVEQTGTMHSDQKTKLMFRLYITDQAPSSMRAVNNLKSICQEYFENGFELEIVDTVQNPLRAVQDGIVVTPTLVKVSPEPSWSIVGDLSEDTRVLASMSAKPPNGKRSP